MKNLRRRRPYITKDFRVWWGKNREQANAVMRAFGTSEKFPWALCTRDFDLAEGLQDTSLLFFDVADDSVVDKLNTLEYDELIFSRMTGEVVKTSPYTCLISKYDIWNAWERIENEEIMGND